MWGKLFPILATASPNSPIETEKISFEGKVVQKLECRPTGSFNYLKHFIFTIIANTNFLYFSKCKLHEAEKRLFDKGCPTHQNCEAIGSSSSKLQACL